jgi:hypothetical protein
MEWEKHNENSIYAQMLAHLPWLPPYPPVPLRQ